MIGSRVPLLFGGGGGAAWTPASLGADRIVSLSSSAGTGGVADADPVTTWTDQTGNGNSPTQGTATKRPLYKVNVINGLPVVRFDGSNDFLLKSTFAGGAVSQPYTALMIFRQISAGANTGVIWEDGDDSTGVFSTGASSKTCNLNAFGSTQRAFKAADYDWHVVRVTYNGASSTIRYDNKPAQSLGNAGTATLNGLSLGADFAGGNVGAVDWLEFHAVNRALTAAEDDAWFAYAQRIIGVLTTADKYAVIDSSANFNAFPGAAVAGNGDILVTYRRGAGHASSKGTIYLARSTDGGLTWGTPTQILSDTTYDLRDPVSLALLSSGRLALTYFRFPVSGTPLTDIRSYYVYSDDNGVTWSSPTQIPTPAGYDWIAAWGDVTEVAAGNLLVTGYGPKTATGRQDSLIFKSTDGGATWSLQGVIAAGTATPRDYTETYIVTTTDDNHLLAVIREDNGQNLYTATSSDGGATWGAVSSVLVNGVAPHMLRLASGDLILTWADRNVGPFGVSTLKSSDHGATWGAWRYRVWCRSSGEDMGYCAPVEVSPGVVGVASYLDSSGSQASIRWDTFRVSSLQ